MIVTFLLYFLAIFNFTELTKMATICPRTDIVTNGNKKVHNKNSNKKTDLLLYRELVTFLGLLPLQHFASQLLGVKC